MKNFRHPHGDSYGVVIVKMIEIQSEASVIFNKYSQIAFDIKCFEVCFFISFGKIFF